MATIKIDSKEYECLYIEHNIISSCEHFKITLAGEFKTTGNKITLEYKNKSYYGYKIFPKYENETTSFLVYVFQKGDKELE